MHPAIFAFARRAAQLHHPRRIVGGQLVEKRLDRRDVGKPMKPRAVQAQFSGSLRAAQQQRGQQRSRLTRQPQHPIHVVFEARHTAAAALHDQAQALQPVDGSQHLRLGRIHHRRAAGFLIAAQGQRVQRKRITVRHGVLLFDEHAEYAPFKQGQSADGGTGNSVGSGVHRKDVAACAAGSRGWCALPLHSRAAGFSLWPL